MQCPEFKKNELLLPALLHRQFMLFSLILRKHLHMLNMSYFVTYVLKLIYCIRFETCGMTCRLQKWNKNVGVRKPRF
jgi:hypothetical protein